ncbi:MAG: hypothetical protein WAV43_06040 [Streptococcus parauberis]
MKNEVFEIRDYLIENKYPQGLINILDDYFTNSAITYEEMDDILKQENAKDIVYGYQLRGAQA